MKVLCLTNEFETERFGGSGTAVTGMVRMFRERGVAQVVVVPQTGGTTPVWDNQGENLRVLRLPRDERYFGYLGLIKEQTVLREFPELRGEWDLIHIHALNLATLAYTIAGQGIPIVYSVSSLLRVELENDPAPELQAKFALQEELIARAQRIHLLSRSEGHHFLNKFPELAARAEVIPLGCRLPSAEWQYNRSQTLLYVGRLVKYKGVEDLLRALCLLKIQGRQFTLDLVGKGTEDYERHLRTLANLGQRVRFHGWEGNPERVTEWMRKASILVVPSHRESFGLVALEGMALGIPIVASTAGGLGELVSPTCALTFPAGDVNALARALATAVDNPQLMRTLGRNARHKATTLEWSKLADRYLGLYHRAAYTATVTVTSSVPINREGLEVKGGVDDELVHDGFLQERSLFQSDNGHKTSLDLERDA